MQATQQSNETINISSEKLLSLVAEFFGSAGNNPNPDEPHKPGPFDPVIRKVAGEFFGPSPEPWRTESNLHRAILEFFAARHPEIFDVIVGRFNIAALNPQPLPPRAKFLALVTQEVIDRALLTQEIADAMNRTGEQQSIIIVSGRVKQFVTDIDELCPRIPRRFPKPRGGSEDLFTAFELLAAGAIFQQNAATVADENMRQELQNAGAKLTATAIARM